MRDSIKDTSKILWKNGRDIRWRVAIVGDFFPVMELSAFTASLWIEKAEILKPYFYDIDFALANLESPIGCEGLKPEPKIGTGANVYGSEVSLQYLKELKINLVGTANNHMMDFGPYGVSRTHEALRSFGIDFTGSTLHMGVHPEIKIVDLGGTKIGFWTAFLNAGKTHTGKTGVEPANSKRSKQALEMMDGIVTCKIALIHAGLEGNHYPDPFELKQLHGFVQDGYDLICISHSHRISGYIEICRQGSSAPGFCFHGLGSIASGCIYGEPEREGLVAVIGLDKTGIPAELLVRVIWLDENGWGIIPEKKTAQLILKRFEKLSDKIKDGSFKKEFYRNSSQNLGKKIYRDLIIAYKNFGMTGVIAKMSRIRLKHLNRLISSVFN